MYRHNTYLRPKKAHFKQLYIISDAKSGFSSSNSKGTMSNWMTPSTGFTSWASYERNGNSSPEAYNLLIKNKSNIFSGDFTGTWLLNGDLVNQM